MHMQVVTSVRGGSRRLGNAGSATRLEAPATPQSGRERRTLHLGWQSTVAILAQRERAYVVSRETMGVALEGSLS